MNHIMQIYDSFPCFKFSPPHYKPVIFGILGHTFDYMFVIMKQFKIKSMGVLHFSSKYNNEFEIVHQFSVKCSIYMACPPLQDGEAFSRIDIFYVSKCNSATALTFSLLWSWLLGRWDRRCCWDRRAVDVFRLVANICLQLMCCYFWRGSYIGFFLFFTTRSFQPYHCYQNRRLIPQVVLL